MKMIKTPRGSTGHQRNRTTDLAVKKKKKNLSSAGKVLKRVFRQKTNQAVKRGLSAGVNGL